MSSPNYITAKSATVVANGSTLAAKDCTVGIEIGEADATNLTSGGFYENVTDIRKVTVSGTLVIDPLNVPNIPFDGSIVTASVAVTGWKTVAGSGRILSSSPRVGPRGTMDVSFNLTFTGSFSIT